MHLLVAVVHLLQHPGQGSIQLLAEFGLLAGIAVDALTALMHMAEGLLQLQTDLLQLFGTEPHLFEQVREVGTALRHLRGIGFRLAQALAGLVQRLLAQVGVVPLRQPQGEHGQDVAGKLVNRSVTRTQLELRQRRAAALQADQPEHEGDLHQGPEAGTEAASEQVGEDDQGRWPEDMRRMQAAQLVHQDRGVADHAGQRQVGDERARQPGLAQGQQHQRHADDQEQRAFDQGAVAQSSPLDGAVQTNQQTAQARKGQRTALQQTGLVAVLLREEVVEKALRHTERFLE